MSRYIGPRLRVVRRLGLLPGLTNKIPKMRTKTPGQHGKGVNTLIRRSSLSDDYKQRLLEKQKLRFNYGITEKQLFSYYQKAKQQSGSSGTNLLELLESRLDCIVYRLGFATTIPGARQIVNHGHILVNNKIVNIPSFLCCLHDMISIKDKLKSKQLILNNFNIQQERRLLILERMKLINLTTSRFHSLLPNHLKIRPDLLVGEIVSTIKRKDILIKIDELKVVEYYSR
jgi:small subunit ribosomal protein S4